MINGGSSCSYCAGMAELVDAQASGACGGNIVWVQVPFPAGVTYKTRMRKRHTGLFSNFIYVYYMTSHVLHISEYGISAGIIYSAYS